ncbi:MAG TPA: hypothetical protein VII44_03230 [Puia sp.]
MLGLMDGSVSTLAPILAVAGLTGDPLKATPLASTILQVIVGGEIVFLIGILLGTVGA